MQINSFSLQWKWIVATEFFLPFGYLGFLYILSLRFEMLDSSKVNFYFNITGCCFTSYNHHHSFSFVSSFCYSKVSSFSASSVHILLLNRFYWLGYLKILLINKKCIFWLKDTNTLAISVLPAQAKTFANHKTFCLPLFISFPWRWSIKNN